MKSVLVLVCVLSVVWAAEEDLGTFKLLHRVVDKCAGDADMYTCLKLKAVGLMDRALAVDTLPLNEYVSIHRDPKAQLEPPVVKTEQELEAALPREQDKRSQALDEMLEERVGKYLNTRTIQLSMPADNTQAGRKKKDKGGMVMMAAAAMGGMMLQMAMGKIALIAGKALLIGKVALLLSAIIGLKKLVGGGGGESHHPQVVYASGGGHHDGWGRSTFDLAEAAAANDLAYMAYRPRS